MPDRFWRDMLPRTVNVRLGSMMVEEAATPPRKPSVTESPWFWLELFSGCAIAAMLIIGPKFISRQGQIERRFQGRQDAYTGKADPKTDPEIVSRTVTGGNQVALEPLILGASVVMVVSALMLARSRIRLAESPRNTTGEQGG